MAVYVARGQMRTMLSGIETACVAAVLGGKWWATMRQMRDRSDRFLSFDSDYLVIEQTKPLNEIRWWIFDDGPRDACRKAIWPADPLRKGTMA